MRRCHSPYMQEYRRRHNQEMWERQVGTAPQYLNAQTPQGFPPRCPVAMASVNGQGVGE